MKKWKPWLIGLVGFLILLRMILPIIGLRVVNWALENKLGSYEGHIEDFDLALYRGSYQLQGLEIRKKQSLLPPLLRVKEIDLQIAWRPLIFQKEIAAHVSLDQAQLQFVDSQKGGSKQLGMQDSVNKTKGLKPSWKAALDIIIPMNIETLNINHSEVLFRNTDLKRALPVHLSQIDFHAENLRTRPSTENSLSPVWGHGIFQDHAYFQIKGLYDALAPEMRGDFKIQLSHFKMETANTLLMAYIPIDITKGNLSAYSEVAFSNRRAEGYAKVFLKDADIIAPKQKYISPKHFGYEILSAMGNWLLKNNKSKKIAVHVPFEAEANKWNIDGKKAFWSALRNWLDELKPGFDQSISLSKLESKSLIKP